MKVYNHELTIRRNETFTIDKTIESKDGSPFILSNKLRNPYFVVTVSSSLYNQTNGYRFSKWLPVRQPRFYTTVPVNLADFKTLAGSQKYPNGFKDLIGTNGIGWLPYGYLNGVEVRYTEHDDALFYWEDEDGRREYKYLNDENKYVDYKMRLVCSFSQNVTKDWVEKSYFYNIDLVTGVLNDSILPGEKPFIAIDGVYPILEPSKINVLSNLKGGM